MSAIPNGMIRCYYIANGYDGAYMVLTKDINEYVIAMHSYIAHMSKSAKCNYYAFGTIEILESDYEDRVRDAKNLVAELNKPKEKTKPQLRIV
jgi:uncharacterized protein YeeX (DUF496 family)